MCSSTKLLISAEEYLYFWEGDVLPENFRETIPFLLHDFFLHIVFTTTVTLVVERSLATFNLMYYEKDTRYFTVLVIIGGQWVFAAATIAFFSVGKQHVRQSFLLNISKTLVPID